MRLKECAVLNKIRSLAMKLHCHRSPTCVFLIELYCVIEVDTWISNKWMTLTQLKDWNDILIVFLSFPSLLKSINIELPAGGDFFVFFCQSTPWINEVSELSIASGLYFNRLFFRLALLKRGVLPSKTVYSLGFAQKWKISCFKPDYARQNCKYIQNFA